MTSNQRKAEFYPTHNIEATEIISEEPARCPGLMEEWVRLVLDRSSKPTAPAIRSAVCVEILRRALKDSAARRHNPATRRSEPNATSHPSTGRRATAA